ncbi:MAG: hypothetical protein K6A67_01485 [Bacteroidales bacterium]|nr:hypothetical protein [Bacteroidales bacterium]
MDKRSVLDVTVVKLVCILELSVYRYIDTAMPKKFRTTLVQQLCNGLGQARKMTIKSMDLAPRFQEQKYYYIDEALSEVHNVEALLNTLNDMQSVSNDAKARFDMQLADIYNNLGRLLNSFEKKLNEADTQS